MEDNRSNESNLKYIFRFDTRNNRELTPYLVFSDIAYSYFSNSYISKDQKFFTHDEFMTELISNLEENIILDQNRSTNKKEIKKYQKVIFSIITNALFQQSSDFLYTFKNLFSNSINILSDQQKSINSFVSFLAKRLYSQLNQMIIPENLSPQFFPNNPGSTLSNSENKNQIAKELFESTLSDLEKYFLKIKQDEEVNFKYLHSNLLDLSDILFINKKSYAFSPSMVNSSIKKLDSILNTLCLIQKFEFVENSIQLNCYMMILFIKMRLSIIIHKMHDFLALLIQIFKLQQEAETIGYNQYLSIEKVMEDTIPICLTSRSTIIKNISNDEIFDFCFSENGKNDFILTRIGIFKLNERIRKKTSDIFDFKNKSDFEPISFHFNRKSLIKDYLTIRNKDETKMAFSDGILYLLNLHEKVVYKTKVSLDSETIKKRLKVLQKIKNANKTIYKKHPKKTKRKKYRTAKRKREEEKKKEKIKRKLEKYKDLEDDEDDGSHLDFLFNFKIQIDDIPLMSIAVYNQYLRIIQKVDYSNQTTTLLFTNVDLAPNCRFNYDVEETFNSPLILCEVLENHLELKIKDINQQFKVNNVFFSGDFMFISFEDSSISQYMIFNNGSIELTRQIISPFISLPNTCIKMDNDMFLYYSAPIKDSNNDFAVSISKMYFPETKCWLHEDNSTFLKYPYLKNLSDLINNCSQFILNRETIKPLLINDSEHKIDNHLNVSPMEMSLVIQEPTSIAEQLETIKDSIYIINDKNLVNLFVTLLIKLIGINIFYESNQYMNGEKIGENEISLFILFKDFILDLYSSFSHSNSIEFDVILGESVIFTTLISGKFLFYPCYYAELHDLTNQILCDNYNYYSKLMLKSFTSLLFSYPSSLYLIDKSIYDQLVEFLSNEDIHELFMKSILFIFLELKFSSEIKRGYFIEYISPYLQSLFSHLKHEIQNETIPFDCVKQLLSYILGYDISNVYFSLILQKELVEISSDLYKRIEKFSDAIESDKEYQNLNNYNFESQELIKEIKIIESNHPFLPNNEKQSIEFISTIDFSFNANKIFVQFDIKCHMSEKDVIMFYVNNNKEPIKFGGEKRIRFNTLYKFNTNCIKVFISRDTQKDSLNYSFWGYKITFIGILENNSYNVSLKKTNLMFYNSFISFLVKIHCHSYKSIEFNDSEKDFKKLLKDKIIQGIKFDDNKDTNDNNNLSKGIEYDFTIQNKHNDEEKTKVLIGLILMDEKNSIKNVLDFIYKKTSKQNRMRLNITTKATQEIEFYFVACSLKHLGLVSSFIDLTNDVEKYKNNQSESIQIPNYFSMIWKKIYDLRKILIFEYQKSKIIPNPQSSSDENVNSSCEKCLEKIKSKCVFLLNSNPILMYKNQTEINDELFKSTLNLIYSFITSKMEASRIYEFLNNRRNRLFISDQSLCLIDSFINQNTLFESSKLVLMTSYNGSSPYSICKGVSNEELNDYKNHFSSLTLNLFDKVINIPNVPMIFNFSFLNNFILNNDNDDILIQCSKVIVETIEKYKKATTLYKNQIIFTLILILLLILSKTKNNDLITFMISTLSMNEIGLDSKRLILIFIQFLIQTIPENKQLSNKYLIHHIFDNNKKNPIIISLMFNWISFFNQLNDSNFILRVLKGIGQSFSGRSCLFIDDSFEALTQRQVCESMISYIRILYNNDNHTLFVIIHNILSKTIDVNWLNEEEKVFISIGLFASLGQPLSSFEPNRKITNDFLDQKSIMINGYNPSINQYRDCEMNNRNIFGSFTNSVAINPEKLNLNENEIENICNLFEKLNHRVYFKHSWKMYKNKITGKEISESILMATFYSFIPIIMQNKNNASIFLNDKNIKKTLKLLELSREMIPSNENSILLLSHYLEQAINNPLYTRNDYQGSYKFIKLNYGTIFYNEENNDIIKSDIGYFNVFAFSRLFDSRSETYFEVKINKIGSSNFFIGFVDSEDSDINKVFGFGRTAYSKSFTRISPYLTRNLNIIGDLIMKDELTLKQGDSIGVYYSQNFVYLIKNKKITQYRLPHKSLQSYLPIIFIDHDEVELEITKNVSSVDLKNRDFNFLNINKYVHDYFIPKDLLIAIQKKDRSSYSGDLIENIKQKLFLIGQIVSFKEMDSIESEIESIDSNQFNYLHYKDKLGIIKDIIPIKDNKFVSKLKIECYNDISMSREIIDFEVDSRFVSIQETNFFNLLENRTNKKFGFNSSFDLNYLPCKIHKSTNINAIKQYVQNKTIKDNSKSISILMTRYLVFILVDYLRYSKSLLLRNEGINTNETQSFIISLAYSLPTITMFVPDLDNTMNQCELNKYLIFNDDEFNSCKMPGFSSIFHNSFKAFLKKSENFISPKFLTDLLQKMFDIACKENSCSSSNLYNLIPSIHKIENIIPFPETFSNKVKIGGNKYIDDKKETEVVGFVPILLSSIPYNLCCLTFCEKRIRTCSDEISYFAKCDDKCNNTISMKWAYNSKSILTFYLNNKKVVLKYKLQCGIFMLTRNMQESLLNGPIGFVQIIFIFIQIFFNSTNQKNNELIEYIYDKVFSLSLIKDSLAQHFYKEFIVHFIVQKGFNQFLLTEKASNFFSSLPKSRTFPQIDEIDHIFQMYSNMIQLNHVELKKENESSLFEAYYQISNELFKVLNDDDFMNENSEFEEGSFKKPKSKTNPFSILRSSENQKEDKNIYKKNNRLLYLLNYYSLLLKSKDYFPIPKFIFIHEYLRQYFGGFTIFIDANDIENYSDFNSDNLVIYDSDVLTNDFDLQCSCQFLNLCENKINQFHEISIIEINKDNNVVKINKNESKVVSFPLVISISKTLESQKVDKNDVFIISFQPTKDQQKNHFLLHYLEIEKEFKQFISYEENDDELTKKISFYEINEEEDEEDEDDNETHDLDSFINNSELNVNRNNNNNNSDIGDENEEEESYNIDNYNQIVRNYELSLMNGLSNPIRIFPYSQNSSLRRSRRLLELPRQIARSYFSEAHISALNNRLIDFGPFFDRNITIRKNTIKANWMKIYEKIGKTSKIDSNIVLLRHFLFSSYIFLIKYITKNYYDFMRNDDQEKPKKIWNFSLSTKNKPQKLYMNQTISLISSLNIEFKFQLIRSIFINEKKGKSKIKIRMNRFEQQKFMNLLDQNNDQKLNKARPLIIQFMQQVNEKSLHLLKVNKSIPFFVTLIGENAIDLGGPGREVFSSLIQEMMNVNLGFFTINPNMRHKIKETNQEDLIPNIKCDWFSKNYHDLYTKKFIYAGALIATCFISDLPQPMKLSSFIWEYLSTGCVTIESIYEIDNNFKQFIESTEKIRDINLNKDEFQSIFLHSFDINDSFDNIVELVPSGSSKYVTKENLHEFINLAKEFRIHEFDEQLIELKRGFDIVISCKDVFNILNPNELKLLICGEPNCDINQMKSVINVTILSNVSKNESDKLKSMFWKVMESFSIDERMKFIRFSSGNLGLPAPGLKWDKNITVLISEHLTKLGKLPHASTCSSTVNIPLFKNEEELEQMLRICIEDSGLITDSNENLETVSEFL